MHGSNRLCGITSRLSATWLTFLFRRNMLRMERDLALFDILESLTIVRWSIRLLKDGLARSVSSWTKPNSKEPLGFLPQPVNNRARVKDYYVVPGWQTDNPSQVHGKLSFKEAAIRGNLVHIQATNVREEEQLWLKGCLLAGAKNSNLLNDLNHLLESAGFFNVKVKYAGGLRVLLECLSQAEALKVMDDGMHTLLTWFNWVCPWSIQKEMQRPGRLLWLSISGVPLHAWIVDNFKSIASVFGRVLEVEDWTADKD